MGYATASRRKRAKREINPRPFTKDPREICNYPRTEREIRLVSLRASMTGREICVREVAPQKSARVSAPKSAKRIRRMTPLMVREDM